ncbi:MAG TPA: phosphoribosylanthranilate isomerase, partial [Thermoanaerobaculia bacterium]|nr:phosphoribosylanthranilate isomerase [Thermoanaerobaculia bacterium]
MTGPPERPEMAVKVKVCGVTRPEDALLAAELGASYLGLNFFPGSPRYVAPARAREIAAAVAGRVSLVGVFVNCPPAEVAAIDAEVGLDFLQWSGDEGPEEVNRFAGR